MMQADSVAVEAKGASLVQYESSRLLPWLMLCAMLSGASLMGSFWAVWHMTLLERESRLSQQHQMDMEALLQRSGIIQPGDRVNGPAGNLQYKPK